MPLKTLVKVGSVTNLSDARYCAGMGVDMLGFRVIEGQDNYLDATHFQEIRGWVAGPLVVAEVYGINNPEELNKILQDFKPDYLEMGLIELGLFSSLPLPLILSVKDTDSIQNLHVIPAYLHCHELKNYDSAYRIMLVVESISDLESALHNPQIKGISMQGGKEVKPGLKDYDALAEILELLEVE